MRQSNVYWVLMAFVLLVSAPPRGAADQPSDNMGNDVLIPQKGHALFGTLQGATDKTVIFTMDCGATTRLSWDKIKEIQIHHKTIVKTENRRASAIPAKSMNLDSLTIQQAQGILTMLSPGQNLTLPETSLVSISLPTKPLPVAWTILMTPKASLISGTQTQQTFGAQISVRRQQDPGRTDWHHQITTLILNANNSLTEQAGTASIRTHEYDGELSHAVYLWDGLYTNVQAEGYANNSLNVYLEQSYGGGLGKRIFQNRRNSLELTSDFLYIAEHFYGSAPSVSFVGTRLAEMYTMKLADLLGGPLELIESGSYTPAFNLKNAWQTRGTVTLVVPINKALSANLSFFDNYIENAPNARNNYSTSSIGLTYRFPSPK